MIREEIQSLLLVVSGKRITSACPLKFTPLKFTPLTSLRKLKSLEAVQFLLDAALQ
jgi:hypothetical protein